MAEASGSSLRRVADRAVVLGVFQGERAPLVPKANAWVRARRPLAVRTTGVRLVFGGEP